MRKQRKFNRKGLKEPHTESVLKKYLCGWCGYQFNQWVRYVEGYNDYNNKPKHNVSSQVNCPFCDNGLKTWEEGEVIEQKGKKIDEK